MPTLTFITEPVLLPNWEHCIRQYLVSNHGRTAKKVMGEVKVIRVVKNWFSGAKAACIWVKGMRPTFVPLWVFVDFDKTLTAQSKQEKAVTVTLAAIAKGWDDDLRYGYRQALKEGRTFQDRPCITPEFLAQYGEDFGEKALDLWYEDYCFDFEMQCPQPPEPELLPGELPGYTLADQKAEAESLARDLWVGPDFNNGDDINFIDWQKQELSVSKFFRDLKRDKVWLEGYVPMAAAEYWDEVLKGIGIEWNKYRQHVLNKQFGEWMVYQGTRYKRFEADRLMFHPIPAYVFEGARQAIAETIEAIKPVAVKATPLAVVKGFGKK